MTKTDAKAIEVICDACGAKRGKPCVAVYQLTELDRGRIAAGLDAPKRALDFAHLRRREKAGI